MLAKNGTSCRNRTYINGFGDRSFTVKLKTHKIMVGYLGTAPSISSSQTKRITFFLVPDKNCLVSPSVTQLSRPRIPSPNTPSYPEWHVSQSQQDITSCYVPITASPNTSGVVVTEKMVDLEGNAPSSFDYQSRALLLS